MMDNRPWNYQIDLFCLASTIYTIVCGKYMNVQKTVNNFLVPYTITEPIPRHLDEKLWLNVIHTLINVRNCKLMPNLQSLKVKIKEAMLAHDRVLDEKIQRFNQSLE